MKPGRKGKLVSVVRPQRALQALRIQIRHSLCTQLGDDSRPATRSNETWAINFVHDQRATGHKLRVLTIVDIFSRFSPALERSANATASRFGWRPSLRWSVVVIGLLLVCLAQLHGEVRFLYFQF